MGARTVDLVVRIDGCEGPPALLDRLSTVLFDDLRAARIGRVGRGTADAGHGSKAGIFPLIGELTVNGMVAAAAVTLYKTLTAFLDRSKARSVTVKLGEVEVVVTAATKHEVADALALAVRQAAGEPADSAETGHDG
jgi:hypothetical protein